MTRQNMNATHNMLQKPYQWVKAGVQQVAIDPFNVNRLATYGGERDDAYIKIWDRRK